MIANRFKSFTAILMGSLFFSVVIPISIGFALSIFFKDWQWLHYPVHSTVESIGAFSAITIAVVMFIMIQHHRLENYFIWAAAALLSMGVLDGFHSLYHANQNFVWLHSIATLLGGILFAAVWFPAEFLNGKRRLWFLILITVFSFFIGIASMLLTGLIPSMLEENGFSLIAKILNFTGGTGFLIGTLYFVFTYRRDNSLGLDSNSGKNLIFMNHCLLFGIAGLLFESSIIWDAGWWWWHVLRLMAYLIILVYFISLFKKEQDFLIDSEKRARDATQTKSDFLATMSHEIRTPMNAVIGMTHLALKTELNSKQRNYLEKVHYSAENLLGILNDILDFSKIESGKLEMESIDFRLEDVIDNVSNIIGIQCKKKGIVLSYEINPEVPGGLTGDPLRLGQILLNLGNNAVKFCNENGSVTVGAEVDNEETGKILLHFWVCDTGIGMTEQQQGKLFQSFRQGDASTTREYGGTGLGLVICKELAELMGGNIWVKSENGAGSTFHFTVRLKKQQGEPSARRAMDTDKQQRMTEEALGKLRGSKVLLVEDSPVNQELALELLVSNGLFVETVNNGRDAVVLLASEDFDGVLMDCQMPVMDGYTATRKIREQERFNDLPIIAMTANAMLEDRQRALDAGMNDHIAKPININQMFMTMAKWIKPNESLSVVETALPQETAMNTVELPTDLTVLRGIDAEASPVSNRPDLYRRLLLKFRENYQDFEQQFRDAQFDKDSVSATRAAHSLKGVAGSIGALEVEIAASELENACKEGNENIDDLLTKVISELKQVIDGLGVLDTLK